VGAAIDFDEEADIFAAREGLDQMKAAEGGTGEENAADVHGGSRLGQAFAFAGEYAGAATREAPGFKAFVIVG
jgi:hypothetical protein